VGMRLAPDPNPSPIHAALVDAKDIEVRLDGSTVVIVAMGVERLRLTLDAADALEDELPLALRGARRRLRDGEVTG
jgi:hypothetical protein